MIPLVLGYALLLSAWVVANPPSAAPDEPSHFAKALAAGRGEFVGGPGDPPSEIVKDFPRAALPQLTRSMRSFHPAAADTYGSLPCFAFHLEKTARCLRDDRGWTPYVSIVGSYPPYAYVPAGLATDLGGSRQSKLWLGRFASAAVSLALIGVAAWQLWDDDPRRRRFTLLGLLLAVTPMAVFLGSEVGANGIEIAAAIAVAASAIRLARDPTPSPAAWTVTGVVGLVLGLTRPLSPAWLGVDGLLFIALAGWRGALSRFFRGRWWSVTAAALWVIGGVLGYGWLAVHHARTPIPPLAEVHHAAGRTLAETYYVLIDMVGHFGWQDTSMPAFAYVAWTVVLGALVGTALAVGRWRDRVLLLTSVVVGFAVILAVGGFVIEASGFGMQGRYVLPYAVVLPLLAGDIAGRSSLGRRPRARRPLRPRPEADRAVGAAVVVAAGVAVAVLFTGWAANGRRYAVGSRGPIWFVDSAQWSPPGGWVVWAGVALCGLALILVGFAWAARSRTVIDLTADSSASAVDVRRPPSGEPRARAAAGAGTDRVPTPGRPPARRR